MSQEKRYYCPGCKSAGLQKCGVVGVELRTHNDEGNAYDEGHAVFCSILANGRVCCSHLPRGVLLEEMPNRTAAPPALPAGWFERYLANDKQARKEAPLARGLLGYFPSACLHVAHVSFVANEQHNPGLPLQWAFGKSADEADCELRHMLDAQSGVNDGFDDDGLLHLAKKAWRAMADLERYVLSHYPSAKPGASVTGWPPTPKLINGPGLP